LIYTNTRLSNGQNIIFGGTHLCHQSDTNRLAQVEAIDQHYRSLLVPSIVCGDFNFENTEASYKKMMNYWRDAAEIRNIPPNTYSSENPTKTDRLFICHKTGKLEVYKCRSASGQILRPFAGVVHAGTDTRRVNKRQH
jgi:hypothetical protein